MRYILIFLMGLISVIGYSQEKSGNIIGEWKTCTVIGEKKTPKCDNSNIYNFKADNTYIQTQNRSKTYILEGVWNYTNKKLMIDSNDDENSKYFPYSNKIKWIDRDTFYTVGREGFLGPKVYTYYFRIQ